jgi:hypothetical protein
MKWPWSKKQEAVGYPAPANDPQQPEEPKPEVDDWAKQYGEWHKVERCHCGKARISYRMVYNHGFAAQANPWNQQISNPFARGQELVGCMSLESHRHDVCPTCGHSDKWHESVVRSEWESSVSRGPSAVRNAVEVVWTPESCTIKDENEG